MNKKNINKIMGNQIRILKQRHIQLVRLKLKSQLQFEVEKMVTDYCKSQNISYFHNHLNFRLMIKDLDPKI
jgi:hypothetical protein